MKIGPNFMKLIKLPCFKSLRIYFAKLQNFKAICRCLVFGDAAIPIGKQSNVFFFLLLYLLHSFEIDSAVVLNFSLWWNNNKKFLSEFFWCTTEKNTKSIKSVLANFQKTPEMCLLNILFLLCLCLALVYSIQLLMRTRFEPTINVRCILLSPLDQRVTSVRFLAHTNPHYLWSTLIEV